MSTSPNDGVGANVTIPANAAPAGTQITVTEFSATDPSLPPPPANSLSRAVQFGPAGQTFSADVSIVFTYTDAEVAGKDEASLQANLLVSGSYVPVDNCTSTNPPVPDPCVSARDASANTISILTRHFSIYTLSAPPVATPTPTPGGFHDAELRKINGAPQVPLPNTKGLTVKVRNNSSHTESIGVYVDIVPPGGITNPFGCTPFGRVIETVLTVAPTVSADATVTLSFDCANRAGAQGQTYTITAVADDHADDLGACGPGQLMSMACSNALADDDSVASNNRLTRNAYQVK